MMPGKVTAVDAKGVTFPNRRIRHPQARASTTPVGVGEMVLVTDVE